MRRSVPDGNGGEEGGRVVEVVVLVKKIMHKKIGRV